MALGNRYILKYYELSNDVERAWGLNWYKVAHDTCGEIAKRYGIELDMVVGVLSVLSPRTVWEQNVIDAENLIKAFKQGKRLSSVTVTTYGVNKKKAWDILRSGTVEPFLKGVKVVAFYENILNPETSEAVTIDGHAVNIVYGKVGSVLSKHFTPKWNTLLQEKYKKCAFQVGLRPHQLQAITWLAYKRVHGIRTNWRMYQEKLPF